MTKAISSNFPISDKLSPQNKSAAMSSTVNERGRPQYQVSNSFEVTLNSKNQTMRLSQNYDVTNMSDRQMKKNGYRTEG